MADQPADRRGAQVFAYLGVSQEESVSEDQRNEIGARIREYLQSTE